MASGIFITAIWLICSVIGVIIHRKLVTKLAHTLKIKEYTLLILGLILVLFLAIYFLAYVIPNTIMDYEWYRSFFRLILPIAITILIVKHLSKDRAYLQIGKYHLSYRAMASASLFTLYLFPLLTIGLVYLLWFIGVW